MVWLAFRPFDTNPLWIIIGIDHDRSALEWFVLPLPAQHEWSRRAARRPAPLVLCREWQHKPLQRRPYDPKQLNKQLKMPMISYVMTLMWRKHVRKHKAHQYIYIIYIPVNSTLYNRLRCFKWNNVQHHQFNFLSTVLPFKCVLIYNQADIPRWLTKGIDTHIEVIVV